MTSRPARLLLVLFVTPRLMLSSLAHTSSRDPRGAGPRPAFAAAAIVVVEVGAVELDLDCGCDDVGKVGARCTCAEENDADDAVPLERPGERPRL